MNGRMYDPILGRMLSPDPYVVDPNFSQDFNRYSYARNNPLVYTDPDGEFILTAAIIVGVVAGAYIGGSAANNTLDPTMWKWDSKNTWVGMGIGGVVGALGGWGFAAAAPAVASTSFFSYFGASGTIAAYGLTGTAAGGAIGYGAGFGAALYSSGGDWRYANQMGGIMSGVGAQIGSLAGMAAGGWAAYGAKLAQIKATAATTTMAKGGGKELYNLGETAAQHMAESGRKVPIQIMDNVLKTTKGFPYPGGSNALMHYSTMWKNGKLYNLEILYDKASNSIWHFKYTQDALGPLPLIK
jgi:hypothetical protein